MTQAPRQDDLRPRHPGRARVEKMAADFAKAAARYAAPTAGAPEQSPPRPATGRREADDALIRVIRVHG
jgi:hypothetical protein